VSDLLHCAIPTLGALRPSDLGNLLWSLSQLKHAPAGVWMEALYRACEPLLHELSRDEVPLVMFALARLQVRRCAGF